MVQVGDVYFVCDGHHRISVAKSLGKEYVDAQVTVWEIAGPPPWERTPRASRFAFQSAG